MASDVQRRAHPQPSNRHRRPWANARTPSRVLDRRALTKLAAPRAATGQPWAPTWLMRSHRSSETSAAYGDLQAARPTCGDRTSSTSSRHHMGQSPQRARSSMRLGPESVLDAQRPPEGPSDSTRRSERVLPATLGTNKASRYSCHVSLPPVMSVYHRMAQRSTRPAA